MITVQNAPTAKKALTAKSAPAVKSVPAVKNAPTAKSASAVLTDTDPQNAETNGWDTVFAMNFITANAALISGWANVDSSAKNVVQSYSDDDTGLTFSLNATFGAWQLAENGDGKNIAMTCPIISGTYTVGTKTHDFSTYSPVVTPKIIVNMNWIPDPGQFSFVIDSGADAIVTDLNAETANAALQTAFTQHGKTLSSNVEVSVQKQGYEWLVQDGITSYYAFYSVDKDSNKFLTIYQFEKAWKTNLTVLAKGSSTDDDPAVILDTIYNNPFSGVTATQFAQLLSDWFNTNISKFNYIFSSLDLTPQLSQSDKFKWIKPTATSYAVTDQGSLDTSIFGVLTMNLNHPPLNSHQVSPYAIPDGANAGFLISGEMFMANMMLSGACTLFNNADPASFAITNDGLTVTNTADMVWGKFMQDDNKQGSIDPKYGATLDAGTLSTDLINNLPVLVDSSYKVQVTSQGSQWLLTKGSGDEYILDVNGSNIDVYLATSVTIGAGNFTMSLVNSQVTISFVKLKYSYTTDYDVFVNYNESLTLKLNEHNVFWYDQVTQNMVVSVVKTKSAITRDIVEGAVAGVLSLIALAGPLLEGLLAASEITEVTDESGTAILDEESFFKIGEENPEEEAASESQASNDAAAQSKGKITNIKAAFKTPKWKIMGTIAALAGAVAGVDQAVDAILEKLANDDWDNVPGFGAFAEQVIGPYNWPGVSGYNLQSAKLAGSLQIGLNTQ